MEAGFGGIEPLPGCGHLAAGGCACGLELEQGIQIVTRLIAFDAGTGDIACRHLALLHGSVVGGRLHCGLGRLYAAFGGGQPDSRFRVIQSNTFT